MVRLPCGSRSISRTRNPRSWNATPRLSVVVVFATPPFWFANAITCVTVDSFGVFVRVFGRGSNRESAIVRLPFAGSQLSPSRVAGSLNEPPDGVVPEARDRSFRDMSGMAGSVRGETRFRQAVDSRSWRGRSSRRSTSRISASRTPTATTTTRTASGATAFEPADVRLARRHEPARVLQVDLLAREVAEAPHLHRFPRRRDDRADGAERRARVVGPARVVDAELEVLRAHLSRRR